ncbi:MAG: four helix bundle protein [Candidatus Omnitrophica bacterium]|nr:four helix bundle protein [Candidatus Omnitrophota bacterium]
MYNFEKLEVWQKARIFVREIYKVTTKYPPEEKFGLTQHTRQSAVSVSSNIAEGGSRRGKTESKRFIEIAIGSLYETVTQMYIALDNNYIKKDIFDKLYVESETIAKMLSGLSSSLNQ